MSEQCKQDEITTIEALEQLITASLHGHVTEL